MDPVNPVSTPAELSRSFLIEAFRSSMTDGHQQIGKKLDFCGTPIPWTNTDTGEVLEDFYHCDLRVCPRCQQRTQRKWQREADAWVSLLVESSERNYLFLTINFPNVAAERSRQQLQFISSGFGRLQSCKQWPGKGSVTAREFTIHDEGSVHFHTHSIIEVENEYFDSANYMDQPAWCDLVRRKFKLPVPPIVDIQRVRGKGKVKVHKGLMNIFGYICKPQPFERSPQLGVLLADQLRNTKRLIFTGSFAAARREILAKSNRHTLTVKEGGLETVIPTTYTL